MTKKSLIATLLSSVLISCGNPGGVSDEFYAKYTQLGAPKILYSCTTPVGVDIFMCSSLLRSKKLDEWLECNERQNELNRKTEENIGYTAGIGAMSTYNKLLSDEQKNCTAKNGEFKVLESRE